jgi:hypothetical protein
MSAEQKAIWVVRGGRMKIENFEFSGARVQDRNGAGIRLERGNLHLVGCRFTDNENGILTSGHAESELTIESSEFANNGAGDGYSHNLYVGAIRRLSVVGSYFHHARAGHLLKSRAAQNHIYYNRLTDEEGGRASYELEFPAGGIAHVVGNIIEQGARTQNPTLISFGAEGYAWPENALYLVHNTLVDRRESGGVFLAVRPGGRQVVVRNNIIFGNGRLDQPEGAEVSDNPRAAERDFVGPARHDYRLATGSPLIGAASRFESPPGAELIPRSEYSHPVRTRPLVSAKLSPGALQSAGGAP